MKDHVNLMMPVGSVELIAQIIEEKAAHAVKVGAFERRKGNIAGADRCDARAAGLRALASPLFDHIEEQKRKAAVVLAEAKALAAEAATPVEATKINKTPAWTSKSTEKSGDVIRKMATKAKNKRKATL